MHRQREDRLSMCSVLYFNLQPLMQWGPELRGIDHATAPSISVLSLAIPDSQFMVRPRGARNKSCTRLHDSA